MTMTTVDFDKANSHETRAHTPSNVAPAQDPEFEYVEGGEDQGLPTCPRCLVRDTSDRGEVEDGQMIHLRCSNCDVSFAVIAEHQITYSTLRFLD